jgi:hypothetical protein
MSWSGGVFNRTQNFVADKNAAIKIVASRMDDEFANYKGGLENCITRDNETPPTADLSIGGFKLTSVAAATLGTDAVNLTLMRAGLGTVVAVNGTTGNLTTTVDYQLGLTGNGTLTETIDSLTENLPSTGTWTCTVGGTFEAEIIAQLNGTPTLSAFAYSWIAKNGSLEATSLKGRSAAATGAIVTGAALTPAKAVMTLIAGNYLTFAVNATFTAGPVTATYIYTIKRIG